MNNRFYSVFILNYYGNDLDEWWEVSGGFEGALEAAFKKIEWDCNVKEIFFWNEDDDRPFARVDREEGWEKYKGVTEYYKIKC